MSPGGLCLGKCRQLGLGFELMSSDEEEEEEEEEGGWGGDVTPPCAGDARLPSGDIWTNPVV